MKPIVIVLVVAALVVAAMAIVYLPRVLAPESAPVNTNQELIGGQKDVHGCLIAAGYSWCEPKQRCLRIWEEKCYEAEEAVLTEIFSSGHNQPVDQTYVTVVRMQDNFASGSIYFGESGGEGGGFLARLAGKNWIVDFEGNGSVDCAKIKNLGYPDEVLEGYCD